MKKLIPCILLLMVFTAQAQNFEGTIKWSMKIDLDPANKARMDEAQRKMNDPATQAKIREMQAKMNDPQMKAVMDANPQMKAQMEATMKMMQGNAGGDMNAMVPKGFTVRMKNQNLITKMEGGPMATEILYLKDQDKSYQLNRENKTYSVVGGTRPEQAGQNAPPKVTKTSELTKIVGYSCTKYLVEAMEAGRTMNMVIWATTEIKDVDVKALQKQRMGRGRQLIYEGVDGIPLRIEAMAPEGKMIMEVIEFKKESLPDSDFTLPADFKETPGGFGKY